VSTAAYRRVIAASERARELLEQLSQAGADDRQSMHALAAELRGVIESEPIPGEIAAAITVALARLGDRVPCAVRSSATAEDLPTASFAGQQESYLDVAGPEAILRHVSRCWASLFTERAVAYRLQRGIDHRSVQMAVIVQRMVVPQAAGVLFTADPVTGHRGVSVVEAVPGLGDAFVAGRVHADRWTMRDGAIVGRDVRGARPLPSDQQLRRLEQLGRRIEARFGTPQDIEWCLADDDFHVVQARPITTLFPVPERDDAEHHVYISVGHQQMMTDAMTPLGISVWQLTAAGPMHHAGGRLFVDATRALGTPSTRAGLLALIGRSDPLIGDALQSLLDRGDFIPELPDPAPASAPPGAALPPLPTDPAIVAELVAENEASVAAMQREIATKSGPALMAFILADLLELKRLLFHPRSHQATMAGMEATWWLDDRLQEWLGESNAADALAQSAPGNVTSEMGLALLDVADAIRPHPAVTSFLEQVEHEDFLDDLPALPGGSEARGAIVA
jgi:pyruvate,water dikinase